MFYFILKGYVEILDTFFKNIRNSIILTQLVWLFLQLEFSILYSVALVYIFCILLFSFKNHIN